MIQTSRFGCTGRARLAALWGILLLATVAVAHATDVSKEYRIKAAFLYNFTKYVEWPPERFAGADRPITLAVLGRNPFGTELEEAVRGRTLHGRGFVVRTVATAAEARSADVVFVGAGEERRIEDALDALHRAGVLTVGESERFAALDGAVTFVVIEGKVRFEINVPAAERGGLKISAQLQKLAVAVRRAGSGEEKD